MGCWYLVEDSKLPNTNNPRPTTHDQQAKLISKSLKSLGWITLKGISKTRLNRLNIGKFAIMSTKSRVANSVKWLKGKGQNKSYSSSLSLFFVSDTMTRYDSIFFYNR